MRGRPSWRCRRAAAALMAAVALVAAGATLDAEPRGGTGNPVVERPWREEKCARYRRAWLQALARLGRDGLSAAFVERHEAFLARGCDDPRDVCPRSPQELAIANVMIIQAMNAGMASTFPPFACNKR